MRIHSGWTSKYKGVCWKNQCNKWTAFIWIDGKYTHVGHFVDEAESAHKYDETAAHLGMQRNSPVEIAMLVSRNPAMVAAVIRINGKRTHLGYFESEEKAVRKYDEVALTLTETGKGEQSDFFK
jgi:hypothetical protein